MKNYLKRCLLSLMALLCACSMTACGSTKDVAQKTEEYSDYKLFQNGMLALGKDDKYGYVNEKGEEVIPFIYEEVTAFKEGRAAVKKEGKWAIIDTEGNNITDFIYDSAFEYIEGFAPVEKDRKWGYVDTSGKEAIPLEYEDAGYFSNGYAAVMSEGKIGFIDKDGKMVISPRFKPFIGYSDDLGDHEMSIIDTNVSQSIRGMLFNEKGYCIVQTEGEEDSFSYTFGIIDEKGNIIGEGEQLRMLSDDRFLTWVSYDLVSIFDENGKSISKEYDGAMYGYLEDAHLFSEGLSAVSVSSEGYGYIDENGKMIIEPQYEDAESFHNGCAAVKKDEKYGLINKKGEYIIEPSYEKMTYLGGNYWVINKDGKEGLADKDGNVVVAPGFEEIFTGKRVWFGAFPAKTSENKWGLYNEKGEMIISNEYHSISMVFEDNYAIAFKDVGEEKSMVGVFNLEGDQIIDFKYNRLIYPDEPYAIPAFKY